MTCYADKVSTVIAEPVGMDTVLLKNGKIHIGFIVKNTPRIIVLHTGEQKYQFKKYLVKKIKHNLKGGSKTIKFQNERNYKAYENFDLDLRTTKPIVAIYPLILKGNLNFTTEELTKWLRKEIKELDFFDILDRKIVYEILNGNELSKLPKCAELECGTNLGIKLGVEYLLLGELQAVDKNWKTHLELIDIANGESDLQISFDLEAIDGSALNIWSEKVSEHIKNHFQR